MGRETRWCVWSAIACWVAAALIGCTSIPVTAITLSDELQQYQKDHVQHLRAISEAFGRILDEEARYQLAPLVDIENRLTLELRRIEGMLAVEPVPTAPVPAEWADEPKVEEFRKALERLSAMLAPWEPWVKRVRGYELMFDALGGLDKVPFDHAILSDASRLQSMAVKGLLDAQVDKKPFPRESQRDQLRSNKDAYDNAVTANQPVARLDALAHSVGSSIGVLIASIKEESQAENLQATLQSAHGELQDARASRLALLAAVRIKLQERRGELEAYRAAAQRNLDAVTTNADEIARGLEALATGLRRVQEAIYRPKNDVVHGLQSLVQNLGQLGVLDKDDVKRYTEKSDELSTKFDAFLKKVAAPST